MDVWRELESSDFQRSKGRAWIQPLAYRLAGLRPDRAAVSSEGGHKQMDQSEGSAENAVGVAKDSTVKSTPVQPRALGLSNLRLDAPPGAQAGVHHASAVESGTPNRGPPKTPKRPKASSPQPSHVSDKLELTTSVLNCASILGSAVRRALPEAFTLQDPGSSE